MEIFDKIPVLESIESCHVQNVYPSTSLDESSIEFELEKVRSIYLDKSDIHLQIKVALRKGRLFVDFLKIDMHGKADMRMSFTDDDFHYLTHVNKVLHSFSNCEEYLNNQQVYNSNVLYGHKALISNKFNASTRINEGILACRGYKTEKEPSDYEKSPFINLEEEILLKNGGTLYGKIAVDLFQCKSLLLPNTEVRLKLIHARPNLYMISYNPHVSIKDLDCSLFTQRVVVSEV